MTKAMNTTTTPPAADTCRLTRDDYRNLAKDRARTEKRKLTYIGQHGNIDEHKLYISGTPYELAYPNDPDNQAGPAPVNTKDLFCTVAVQEPLQVVTVGPEPVKGPLPPVKNKRYKNILPNGRNKKPLPSFDRWHCRIFPKDITYPAWRNLTKTATDVANICKAKFDRASAMHQKDTSGKPIFDFTVSEAENIFKLTRPTFTKAIKLLLSIEFIECVRPGGMDNGDGIKALYSLSEKWKSWEAPMRDNSNIIKAREEMLRKREQKKQNPCKGALTTLGKGALNGQCLDMSFLGKGALNESSYFPV